MADEIWTNALGSATAGVISRTLTHPLDTAKSRLQVQLLTTKRKAPQATNVHYYKSSVDVLRKTFQAEGIGGLYRGFGAVIVGGTPGTILYLCSYEIFKEQFSQQIMAKATTNAASTKSKNKVKPNEWQNFVIHFCSGLAAEAVACMVYVPVDVIKERLQVQHYGQDNNYKGTWHAFQVILRTEGISGIYKGYAATLGSFGPFSALYFVFYERFKGLAADWAADTTISNDISSSEATTPLPLPWTIVSSASAGALASFLTSPLDMAKLRLQVQRGQQATNSTSSTKNTIIAYRGVLDCLQTAFQQGGMRGLFRGAGARVLHFVPATTITMTAYEHCRSFFKSM